MSNSASQSFVSENTDLKKSILLKRKCILRLIIRLLYDAIEPMPPLNFTISFYRFTY